MQHKKQKNYQDQKDKLNSYARFSGIAIQMIAIIGLGTFAGLKLDNTYPNKYNLFSVVLSFTSVILAIVLVVKRVISKSKDKTSTSNF